MCKTFFFEGADEALLDGDAAMPANCAEPDANVVVVAPFEVVLAELAALIADGVLRRVQPAWGLLAAQPRTGVSAKYWRGSAGKHMAKFGGPVHRGEPPISRRFQRIQFRHRTGTPSEMDRSASMRKEILGKLRVRVRADAGAQGQRCIRGWGMA